MACFDNSKCHISLLEFQNPTHKVSNDLTILEIPTSLFITGMFECSCTKENSRIPQVGEFRNSLEKHPLLSLLRRTGLSPQTEEDASQEEEEEEVAFEDEEGLQCHHRHGCSENMISQIMVDN
ncbi:hypothetical protein AAC387_Pa03g0513 [Persea americana]|eukprot:TRINITY_DN12831_c2_g4_i2.p1 TRINITY_DN12831_c2_g4~~TRINITY_DN12831_c2_g4_i2.p1  ORF type:complete len:123 (-),score=27.08 TRINITY_DN12831_c2_g4_i2:204-572(-)